MSLDAFVLLLVSAVPPRPESFSLFATFSPISVHIAVRTMIFELMGPPSFYLYCSNELFDESSDNVHATSTATNRDRPPPNNGTYFHVYVPWFFSKCIDLFFYLILKGRYVKYENAKDFSTNRLFRFW